MITIPDLQQIVPAAFATAPSPDVSDVYEFIPTLPIIERLMAEGWQLKSAYQSRKADIDFGSHRIVFDVPNVPAMRKVGDVFPTATLFNSHNRTRRFSLSIGFFRTVCSNQAQVAVLGEHTDRIHIRGFEGVDFQTLINGVMHGLEALPLTFAQMIERQLSPAERSKYGREVLSIRRYAEPTFAHLFTVEDASLILEPRRREDGTMSLWHTFNVAQEAVLHGSRHGVQDVSRNKALNLALWAHAQTYLN